MLGIAGENWDELMDTLVLADQLCANTKSRLEDLRERLMIGTDVVKESSESEVSA